MWAVLYVHLTPTSRHGLEKQGGYNLLHGLCCTVQVDHALVDPHLVAVPCLRALPTGRLPRGDAERLCRHANRAFHLQHGLLRTLDEITTYWEEGGGDKETEERREREERRRIRSLHTGGGRRETEGKGRGGEGRGGDEGKVMGG